MLAALSPTRRRLVTALLTAVLLAALTAGIILGIGVGSASLSPAVVTRALVAPLGLGDGTDVLTAHIVVDRRLPRVLAALTTGAGLALAGTVLQSPTGNPLADPYILGISGGALLGAVCVLAGGVTLTTVGSFGTVTSAAFLGGMLALLLVSALSVSPSGTLAPTRMILAGVAVGQLTGAASSAVVYFGDRDAARRVAHWTLGSLAPASWQSLPVTAGLALTVGVLVLSQARRLDAFAFGDAAAASLGVSITRLRWTLYSGVSLMTAALVAQAGLVGFVGLVVPHIIRILCGPLHRTLLPLSLLLGATLLVWADILCRVVLPKQELPVGLVTALVGVPLFLLVLHRERVRG